MKQRIIISTEGIKISKPGIDAAFATADQLTMYPGMSTMSVAAQGTVTLTGGTRLTVPITNPTARMPFVTVNDSNGGIAHRSLFCAETSPPYASVFIRNDVQSGAPTRTIRYSILVDNSFV